jgi:hypothetical protein
MGPSHYQFWHTTGTCGTFGAAAAAGKILGLSKPELAMMLGTAGTQAAGLWEFLVDGAMSKQLHPAKAAADGLLSALLAEQGFTAASRIFEGEKGFCQAMAREGDRDRLVKGLGTEPLRILSTSFKAHAACYHIHSAIDAVLEVRRKHALQPADVKSVRISLYPAALDLLEKVAPRNPYAAKFNIPFCVATALVYGQVGLSAFTADRLDDSKIEEDLPRAGFRAGQGLSGTMAGGGRGHDSGRPDPHRSDRLSQGGPKESHDPGGVGGEIPQLGDAGPGRESATEDHGRLPQSGSRGKPRLFLCRPGLRAVNPDPKFPLSGAFEVVVSCLNPPKAGRLLAAVDFGSGSNCRVVNWSSSPGPRRNTERHQLVWFQPSSLPATQPSSSSAAGVTFTLTVARGVR